jgi:hypothetical protein
MSWYDVACSCVGAQNAYEMIETAHSLGLVQAGERYGLTNAEVMSICSYTSSRKSDTLSVFELVNYCLRFPEQFPDRVSSVQPLVTELTSALMKLPAFQGDVFRFTYIPDDVLHIADTLGRFMDRGFLSASSDPDVFDGRDILLIRSETGLSISEFSLHPGEKEVIFLPGTAFEVEKLDRSANGVIILLNEVADV